MNVVGNDDAIYFSLSLARKLEKFAEVNWSFKTFNFNRQQLSIIQDHGNVRNFRFL